MKGCGRRAEVVGGMAEVVDGEMCRMTDGLTHHIVDVFKELCQMVDDGGMGHD